MPVPGPACAPLALAPPPLPGHSPPSFWAAVPPCALLGPVIPGTLAGKPVPGNCARLLLAPLERVWERGCRDSAVCSVPVPYPAVSPVTRPVGLPPAAHSSGPVGSSPKHLRRQEPRNVPRPPERLRRQQQAKQKLVWKRLGVPWPRFLAALGAGRERPEGSPVSPALAWPPAGSGRPEGAGALRRGKAPL